MIELNTTYPLNNIFATARRLDIVQAQPPQPLPRHRDRDGPTKDQQHRPVIRRVTGPQNAPPRPSGTRRGVWTTFGGN